MLILILSSVVAIVAGKSCWTEVKKDFTGLTQVSLFATHPCFTLCSYLEVCTTLRYDTSADPPCFVQTGPIEEGGDLKETARVFQIDRSIYAGEICWTKYENQAANGLIETTFDNLFYCLIYCIGMRNCGGTTFDANDFVKCRVHIGKPFEFKDLKRVSKPNAATYELDTACLFPEGM